MKPTESIETPFTDPPKNGDPREEVRDHRPESGI
jgi:hypothetical protein